MLEKKLEKGSLSEIYPIVNVCKTVYEVQPHSHPVFEFFYLKSGAAFFQINDKKYKLLSGDVVFIEPMDVHNVESISNSKFEYISFVFDNSVFGNENAPSRMFFDSIRVNRIINLPKEILNLMSSVCLDEYKNLAGYELLQNSVLFAILSHITISKQYQEILILRSVTKYNISAIDKAVEYVREHYKESIVLQDVLNLTNYSKSHFIKLFRDVTGCHFTEYVNKYRIERAALDLLYTKKNITEIATDFGFNNIQYFSRVFKEYMKCTPKQFQKKGSTKL